MNDNWSKCPPIQPQFGQRCPSILVALDEIIQRIQRRGEWKQKYSDRLQKVSPKSFYFMYYLTNTTMVTQIFTMSTEIIIEKKQRRKFTKQNQIKDIKKGH